jgi:hypothetical protein
VCVCVFCPFGPKLNDETIKNPGHTTSGLKRKSSYVGPRDEKYASVSDLCVCCLCVCVWVCVCIYIYIYIYMLRIHATKMRSLSQCSQTLQLLKHNVFMDERHVYTCIRIHTVK